MKQFIKQSLKMLIKWVLKEELDKIRLEISAVDWKANAAISRVGNTDKRVDFFYSLLDVGVDVHTLPKYNSWAVVCLQGKTDYVKFINLGDADIKEISKFLSGFGRQNRHAIDAEPFLAKTIRNELKFW